MSFSDAAYNLSALEECLELLGLSNGLSTSYENVYVEPPPFSITLPSGKFGSALTSSALLSTAMKFLWSACFWTVSYVIHADVLHLLIFKQLLDESSCGTRISSRGYYLVLWKEPSASSENFPRSIRASDCLHRILSLIFQAWNLPQLRIQHSLLTIWQKSYGHPFERAFNQLSFYLSWDSVGYPSPNSPKSFRPHCCRKRCTHFFCLIWRLLRKVSRARRDSSLPSSFSAIARFPDFVSHSLF